MARARNGSSANTKLLFAVTIATIYSRVLGFGIAESASSKRGLFFTRSRLESAATTTAQTTGSQSVSLPSWEDLAARSASPEQREPVLTLYRDTNGWCPFCERVWLCVRAKNLPYRERLINLQDKPEWFKELVPTALVPAILLHDDQQGKADDASTSKPQRRLIWESLDIMKALDDAFPSTPRMVLDSPEYLEASAQGSSLTGAGVKFTYGARNATRTAQEMAELKNAFEEELDVMEQALADHGGPFRLGPDFTGVDAEIIPAMERWRYQLPITHDMDIINGRPNMQRWFDTLDAFDPYRNRVSGDAYSWAAVSSTFLKIFGGEETPALKATIEKADATAAQLVNNFVLAAESVTSPATAAKEAAAKLISNHEAVVNDCTNQDPKSQKHVARGSDADAADAILRHVTSILVSPSDDVLATARSATMAHVVQEDKHSEASLAAQTVASRVCAPRDMSAPAAILLRGVLKIVADQLDNQ
jgi:glutathione S-transferase